MPRRDVVQNRQVAGQREMLVHHPDPRRQRRARVTGGQGVAEHLNRPRIGHIVTEEDVHQRGLARAVFAQKRDHLAPPQRQRDGVIRPQRTEALW